MKKMKLLIMVIGVILTLTACKSVVNVQLKPKVNIDNVPWEVKMGINDYDSRAVVVNFQNNSEFTITELALSFRLKENIEEEKLDDFYSYLKKEYNISEDLMEQMRETGVAMNSRVYLDEDEYVEKGNNVEDTLLYGFSYIKTLKYYDMFEPDMYKIEYVDELGEEHITYYDYLNKTYTEK